LGSHEGSGGLGTVVTSNGQLQISGNNISVGDESLTISGNLNSGSLYNSGTTNVWGGSITIGGVSTTIWNQSGSLTINPASGSAVSSTNLPLTISGNGSSTISGTVSLGTGALSTNNGTVTLMVGNVYSGITTVGSGVLNIRNSTSLGTGAVTVENGATLQLQGGISVGNALTLKGYGVSSAGSLRSISGDNIYDGNITLSTNAVRINTDANTLTMNGNISGGSIALYVGGSGNTIMNGVMSGAGGSVTWGATPSQVTVGTSFVKDGNGTVTFVGVNTYTGATVLDGGLLQLGANNVISNSSNVIFDGGRLNTGGYSESVGSLSVLAESSSVTLGSGSHVLSFSGLGTLDYKTLTINGWSGTAGSAGSDGVFRVGNSLSFTRAQLDQFKFSYNSATYSSVQLSDGELVPGVTGATGFVNVRITNSGTTNGSWSTVSGTATFVPSANNATINIADIYTYLYTNAVHVTINTVLASGTQVGQVDINNAVTGDLNSNSNRTLTMNANGDINVSQSITLASSNSSICNTVRILWC
jgi:autotransporter-associated beta strand protein